MATPKETVWAIEPHTQAKHEILKRYLEAWFPILSKHNQKIVYIDGFCGPGRYRGGEPGSPIVALEVAATHRSQLTGKLVFIFVDESEDRIAHLRTELAKMAVPQNFEVIEECAKFDEFIGGALEGLSAEGASPAPTFAFVDPFGFSGIPFRLVEQLLRQDRCEVLVTFMVDSVNRWLTHPDEKVRGHISEMFGTDEATAIAGGDGDRVLALRTLYQSQLQTVARFVRYFEMRDNDDRVVYYLFFASNHERGHLRMKEAMWRVDPDGEFRFSDATIAAQHVLFEADPAEPLLGVLRTRFETKGLITGVSVRQFVENETPFLKKHMRASLRRAEAEGTLQVEPLKVDGTKRRATYFPDDTRMSFVVIPNQ